MPIQRRIIFCVEALLCVRVLIEMSVKIDRIMGDMETSDEPRGSLLTQNQRGKPCTIAGANIVWCSQENSTSGVRKVQHTHQF